jgi:hypothetical protein
MVKNMCWSSCKVPFIPVRFLIRLEFSRQIFEETSISNLMKIRSVGAELFLADGRTDITKLIVAFRNFVNAPKKGKCRLKINLLPLSVCVSLCPFKACEFLVRFHETV